MTMQEWNAKYNESGLTAENVADMRYACENNLRKAEEALRVAEITRKGIRAARANLKNRRINFDFAYQAHYELCFEVER